jgi:hypothetical protein
MSLYQQTSPFVPQVGLVAVGEGLPAVVTSVAAGTTSGTGISHLVPATAVPTGQSVALLGVVLSAAGAVVGNFQSSTTVAVATGNIYIPANGTVVVPASALPYFTSAAGEGLDWNQTTGAYAVGITAVWCTFLPTQL